MAAPNEPPIAAEIAPFRDEIFDWPIASLNNVDVWDLIFKNYVTHPSDQQNLVVASPQFFGPLQKEKKCSNLFGEVLDILHRKHYLTLSKKEFLCFRGLSKTCKMSIDRVLRINNHCYLHDSGSQHDTYDPKHVCWNSNFLINSFLSLSMLERKIKTFSGMNLDEGLIQLGGSLGGLWIDHCDVDKYPNLEALLSPVGSQIYHLKISFDWASDAWNEKYRVLRSLLGIMPNLVSLRVEGFCHNPSDRDKKYRTELRRCIEGNPLPSLKRLIYLRLQVIPTEVGKAVFAKYAATLEKLSMLSVPVINACWQSSELSSKANIVTDLWITMRRDYFLRSLFQNLKWPASLRNVHLWVLILPEYCRQYFQPFCNALLEQLSSANHRLNSLSISIEGERYHQHSEPLQLLSTDFRISLPFLSCLWIRSSLLFTNNFDFILGVSDSLEELVMNLSRIKLKQEDAEELIWFTGYWHRMYESNIWEKMPRLRKLTIRLLYDDGSLVPGESYEYVRTIPRDFTEANVSKEIL